MAQAELLKTAAATLRTLSAENTELQKTASLYQRRLAAEQVVQLMIDRGIVPAERALEKVANLAGSQEDLDVLRQSIQLRTPDMGFAKVASDHDGFRGRNAAEQLEDFLLTGGVN